MMVIRPYRFVTAGMPVIGTVTPLVVDDGASDWTTKTFSGTHTSSTGNVMLMMATRSNSGPAASITGATWDGAALTAAASGYLVGVGRAVAWSGFINGGATGPRDLVVTASGMDVRDFIGWAFDVDRPIAIGATPAPVVTHVVKSSESIAITPTDPNSLLAGMITALDEDINPMSLNSGWTELDNQKTGAGGGSDLAAILASRAAGSLSAKTLTGVSDALRTTDDWAALALELLPA